MAAITCSLDSNFCLASDGDKSGESGPMDGNLVCHGRRAFSFFKNGKIFSVID